MSEPARRSAVILWIVSAAILVSIVLLSVGPDPDVTSGLWQTVGHALAYAALTLSLLMAAVWRPGRGHGVFPKGATTIVGGIVGTGILIEIAQLAVGRDPDPLDVLANAAGVLVSLGLWQVMRRRSTS